ncbi:hypothetical protein STRDD13_00954 [Streptococcus sp. DD13]|nr:hypothetical protein STRDD13_00954 [Streptococcus sp. DD13]
MLLEVLGLDFESGLRFQPFRESGTEIGHSLEVDLVVPPLHS